MPYVTYCGHTSEVSEAYFLFAVEGAVDSAYYSAESLLSAYNDGLVDATEQRGSPVPLTLETLGSLTGQIEDGELRTWVEGFHDGLRQMAELNGELLAVVARFENLPPPQDRHDRRKLRDRLRKYERLWRMWLPRTSFQRVLVQGARIYRALIHGKWQIDERLAELRAKLPASAKERPEPDIAWRLMEGPVGIALSVSGWLSSRHVNGFPDVTGEWRALGREALDLLRAAMPSIDDPVLQPAAEALYAHLERQVETTDLVLEEVARFAGLSVPQDEAGREALWEKLAEYDAVAPVWVREPALQRLRQEVLEGGCAVEENRRRILARQEELRAAALAKKKGARAEAAGGEAAGAPADPS